MKAPFVRNPYNYDTDKASDESALRCPEPTLAQQQFAEESDINFIAERYGLTGEMPQVANPPRYGDFTGVFDFQSANNAVIAARASFMELPAKLRARFDNDPQKLLTFIEDPENRDEAVFLGLFNKPTDTRQSPVGDVEHKADGDTLTGSAKGSTEPTPPPPKDSRPPK